MNREILFRGKRADTGEWIEGYYCRAFRWAGDKNPTPAIQEADCYSFREIIPETVGQYTGMKDKNNRKIFEGDLLKDEFGFIHEVYFDGGCFMRKYGLTSHLMATTSCVMKIIGNIYDNPQLLESAGKDAAPYADQPVLMNAT